MKMLSQNAVRWLFLTTYLYRPWTCLFQTLQICENRDVSEALNRACIIEDISEDDYQSCEEDESIIKNSSDQTVEGKAQSNMNTTRNTNTSHRIEGSEGDCTEHEVIEGVTLLHPHYTSPIGRIDPEPPPVRANTEFPVTQRLVSVKELADVSDDLGRKGYIGKFDSVIKVPHLIEPVEKQEDTAPSILINTKVKLIFHKIEEIKVAHYNTSEGNDTNSDKECAALDSIKQASTMSISDKKEHFNNLPLTVMVKDPEYEVRPSHFKIM